MKNLNKLLLTALFIAIFFIVVSYLVQTNLEKIKSIIEINIYLGIIVFMLLEVASIVVAPLTTVPFLPIASNVFGWQLTAFLSIISWTTGSMIAFLIGKKYGKGFVKKYSSMDIGLEKLISKKHLFFVIVVLKIAIPTDIISYSLGIFTNIKTKMFFQTSIGIIPNAFFLAYLGTLPTIFQIIGFALGLIFVLVILFIAIGKKGFKHIIKKLKK